MAQFTSYVLLFHLEGNLPEIIMLLIVSVYKWESVLELYSDVHMFGLKSANSKAVKNSNLAISWLGATFPELTRKEVHAENAAVLRAQPYALFDASISLQMMSHVNIHECELSDC
ncbi:hypothetical protein H5410_035872 [Solanum commersonii]|uniref:Uncharacterized protein n=1 Tax=Solanum commersonii TaxID=4109 RepID=A0A9J5Y4W9_SOLCO|nr:hypothetical protein H5410_035872 [Solanum commersonii]